MVDIHLSLRQRKLLHYIQDQHSYVTGTELANYLQAQSGLSAKGGRQKAVKRTKSGQQHVSYP